MCHRSVGLVQGAIERTGIPTVTVSMRPEITASMNVSRGAYVRFPLGNPFGEAGRPDQQRRILEDLLQLLEGAEEPTLIELPYRWRRWDRHL
ncbi:MAG: hypothetical protein R3324_16010 [Halobacteriales archaeon]|nr:hypothetical protein [Halobacteriales archaeon]